MDHLAQGRVVAKAAVLTPAKPCSPRKKRVNTSGGAGDADVVDVDGGHAVRGARPRFGVESAQRVGRWKGPAAKAS